MLRRAPAQLRGRVCTAAAVLVVLGGLLGVMTGAGAPPPPTTAVPHGTPTGSMTAAGVAADPTYAALRAARPDGRVAAVHGLALDRDAFHLVFEEGTFHFLAPVGGRTVGAVFLGRGTLRLSPATMAERRQLALELGAGADFEVLTDGFDEMVLLFADDTAEEIGLVAPIQPGTPDLHARQVYERWFEWQRTELRHNLQLRLLRDLLNHPGLTSGVFAAMVTGKKVPPALLAVDPEGAAALLDNALLGHETTLLQAEDAHRGGLWYLCDSRAAVEGGRPPGRPVPAPRPPVRVLHYQIETSIVRDTDLGGVAIIRFQVEEPGLRVLPFNLMPKLRIAEAQYAVLPAGAGAGADAVPGGASAVAPENAVSTAEPEPDLASRKAAAVVQEDAKEDGGDAAVVFPEPLPKGAQVLLRLAYAGDQVLRDGGDKNYYVQARASWYPNLNAGVFGEPAPFDLAYRVPAGNQVVSVGRLRSSSPAGAQTVSEWRTDGPVRVAGFNYGKFKEMERHDEGSGIDVQVFTNPGTPDVVRMINAAMSGSSGIRSLGGVGGYEQGGINSGDPTRYNSAPQATLGVVNTSRLAESAMADGINAARLFTTYFGPLAERHVAITQQSQFDFGQSWPSLIFMPYIAFLDGTQRQRLGLSVASSNDFVDQVGYHEFAHQWWGHQVAPASYHDLWLGEGFAEFSAALALQHAQGWGAYDHFWQEARKQILAKPPRSAVASIDAGPLTQGFRVATERSPHAYRALIYAKGAFVLHMLRMLMWDGAAPTPDHRFIDMMHDYAASFAGRQATTADFQRVVERHVVPAMNATGDGRMDWFFRQWVYGTEVPRLTADLHLEPAGEQVRIRGKIVQEGVSADFRTLVPIYLEFDKAQFVRVGLLPLTGAATQAVDVTLKPPKKPRGVLINARNEVLTRD